MVAIGNYNELEVVKFVDFGVYLNSEDGEILLPLKYVPENLELGDKLNVFIYRDSEDRMIATTLKPKATVGPVVYGKETRSLLDGASALSMPVVREAHIPSLERDEHHKRLIDQLGDFLRLHALAIERRVANNHAGREEVASEPGEIEVDSGHRGVHWIRYVDLV